MSTIGGGLMDRRPCPVCNDGGLKPHCPHNKACMWMMCDLCGYILDVLKKRTSQEGKLYES